MKKTVFGSAWFVMLMAASINYLMYSQSTASVITWWGCILGLNIVVWGNER
jgi:hypothetical protein